MHPTSRALLAEMWLTLARWSFLCQELAKIGALTGLYYLRVVSAHGGGGHGNEVAITAGYIKVAHGE